MATEDLVHDYSFCVYNFTILVEVLLNCHLVYICRLTNTGDNLMQNKYQNDFLIQ